MSIEELLQQARNLTPEEQLQLVASLVNNIREQYTTTALSPRWSDIRGTAPYPLTGEDAQDWVSRTRQEDDTVRAQQLTHQA